MTYLDTALAFLGALKFQKSGEGQEGVRTKRTKPPPIPGMIGPYRTPWGTWAYSDPSPDNPPIEAFGPPPTESPPADPSQDPYAIEERKAIRAEEPLQTAVDTPAAIVPERGLSWSDVAPKWYAMVWLLHNFLIKRGRFSHSNPLPVPAGDVHAAARTSAAQEALHGRMPDSRLTTWTPPAWR